MKIEVWHLGYVSKDKTDCNIQGTPIYLHGTGDELTLNEIRFYGMWLFASRYYFGVLDGNDYIFTVYGMDDYNEKRRFWVNAF